VAALATASLSESERRTLERWVELLRQRFGKDLHAVWLFGSRARGEPPHEESDVDVLVLLDDPSYDRHLDAIRLIQDAADAEGASGTYFSVKAYDREWLEGRREIESFFIQEVESRQDRSPRRRMSPRSKEFMDGARERLAAARTNLDANLPYVAVGLAYYAMLYAARAALSEEDRYAKTHSGTWTLFRELFVQTGGVDPAVAAPQRFVGAVERILGE
jgi:predicted nucleotidyltransferase